MKSPALFKLIKSVFIVTCLTVMSGCGPKISPHQRQQMTKLIETGSRLNVAVKAGVSFNEFEKLFVEYNAAYELVNSNFPEALSAKAKEALKESKSCWSFAEKAWRLEKEYGEYADWPLEIPNSLIKLLPTSTSNVNGKFGGREVVGVKNAAASGLSGGSNQFETLLPEFNKVLNH
jgi:hypothetical protein